MVNKFSHGSRVFVLLKNHFPKLFVFAVYSVSSVRSGNYFY